MMSVNNLNETKSHRHTNFFTKNACVKHILQHLPNSLDDVDTIASISNAVISIITEARAPDIKITQTHPCYMSTERKARRILSFRQSRRVRVRQSSVARCVLFLLRPLKTPSIGRVNIQAGGTRFFCEDKQR